MEKGLPTRRFICEHQVVPELDLNMVRNIHKTTIQGIKVLYTFTNIDQKCMYSVIESHDRLTVEAFFSELRIPCDMITEVEVQGEGRETLQDLREIRRAA